VGHLPPLCSVIDQASLLSLATGRFVAAKHKRFRVRRLKQAARDAAAILDEVRAIDDGGGFGSIMGHNPFQRDRLAAVGLMGHIIRIYEGETP
jgi:hypothetical protein